MNRKETQIKKRVTKEELFLLQVNGTDFVMAIVVPASNIVIDIEVEKEKEQEEEEKEKERVEYEEFYPEVKLH